MKPITGYLGQADISSFGVNLIGQEHSMDALCSGGMRMIELNAGSVPKTWLAKQNESRLF
jgi:hypothetical protein